MELSELFIQEFAHHDTTKNACYMAIRLIVNRLSKTSVEKKSSFAAGLHPFLLTIDGK